MSPIHHGRRIGSAAALVLAGAFSAGCIDGQAQDNSRAADAPRPLPSATPDAAKPASPAPAPAAAAEPHGNRPIDDGAIRALAEEVARLRAELAKMRERNPDAATAAEAAPTQPQIPLLTDGPAPQPAPSAAAPVDPRPSEPEATAPAQGPERIVERVVEREVPVYIEVPGVERVVETVVEVEVAPQYVIETGPTVYVERVVYRDTSCEQTISFGHVHHIGCGHHYYGCSCHPWYYNLDGGFGIQFFHVGHDGHDDHDNHGDHGRPPRGTYARGYNNGFDAGYDAGNDVRPPARPHGNGNGNGNASGRNPDPIRERGPSEPVRRLENGGSERPSAQHPPAPPASSRQDVGTRAPGSIGEDSRAPREPSRRPPTRPDIDTTDRGRAGDGRGPRAEAEPRHTRPDPVPPRMTERSPRVISEPDPVLPVRPEPQRTRPTPRVERDDPPAREPRRIAPENRTVPDNRGERRIDPPVQRPQVERRDPPVLRQPETPRAPAPRRPDAPERRPRHRNGEEEGK